AAGWRRSEDRREELAKGHTRAVQSEFDRVGRGTQDLRHLFTGQLLDITQQHDDSIVNGEAPEGALNDQSSFTRQERLGWRTGPIGHQEILVSLTVTGGIVRR